MRLLAFAAALVLLPITGFSQVVINEIMFHPPSENPAEEFIELYNTGLSSVDVSGWRFISGVDFTIPAGTLIPSHGYLVVTANIAAFSSKYPTVTTVVGGWTGTLSNSANRLVLEDAGGSVRDEVRYSDDGDWGQRRRQDPSDFGHRGWVWFSEADGHGKSLELVNAAFLNESGQNWKASLPNDGTPGAENSVAATNIAPVIDRVEHFPLVPSAAESVTISCRVRDDHAGLLTVKLFHRLDGAATFAEVSMRDDGTLGDAAAGDQVFSAIIPPQVSGSIVEFYCAATDADSATRTWPAPARDLNGDPVQTQNCLYLVDDSAISTGMPVYRMVMRAEDRAELNSINADSGAPPYPFLPTEEEDQTLSHARFNATFLSFDGTGSEVRYLSGVRNRGNGSRSLQPQSFHVQFANADSWNGRVAIALNSQNTPWQLLGHALYRQAGLVSQDSRAVQVRLNTINPAPGTSPPAYGFYVCNEVLNGDFADHHFPLDPGGNIYRSQRLFEDTTAGGTEIRNGGDLAFHTPAVGETLSQVELYKLNYRKETNNSEDNWADLIGLTAALAKGHSGAAVGDPITYDADYLASVQAVADIPQFVRWFAVQAFADNEETNLSNGDGDDYYLYFGEADGRARLLPYDLDTILGRSGSSNSATHGIFRMADDDGSPVAPTPMNAFIKHPEIVPLYYGELQRLLDGPFLPANFDPFCDSILKGTTPVNAINTIKAFNAARHAHITTLVPRALTVTSALPIMSGLPRSTTATTALSGRSNAAETRSVKVNGVAAVWTAWTATWNATGVALQPGVNRIFVQAFDANSAEIDRAFFDVWYDDGNVQNVSGTLAANTTWSAANGPYQVTAALTVPAGVTLTIEPGTSVYLASGVTLTVTGSGRILAEGTESLPIRFGPVPGGAAWGRIALTDTTVESRIAYAHFTGNSLSAVDANNAIVALDHLSFGNTAVKYLDLDGSSFVVSNCVFPTATAEFEPVHGTGGVKAGGRAIIRDCFFGRAQGYNDVIDFTGGNRPGPILQVLNNVFIGSDDDILDLDGTDTWVEGNIFMHVHRNGSPDSASAVSGGDDSGDTSEITIVGNLFYDVDQAATAKLGNFYTMLSNTIVDQNGRESEDSETAVVNLDDEGVGEGLGVYMEGNIVHSAVELMRNYNPAASTVTLVNNLLCLPWSGPGSGNVVADALLEDPFSIPTPNEANWRQMIPVIRAKFALQPCSPAIGIGPNGTDLGGVRPLGVSIGGAPRGTTNQTGATLTVGTLMVGNGIPATAEAFPAGSGWTHYQWRIDGGSWSTETAISTPITLVGLPNGPHTVEVIGRNDAAYFQNHPEYGESARISSATWTVDSAFVPPPGSEQIRIHEVLAQNTSTLAFGGTYPDLIELHNPTAAPVALGGWGLTDNIALPFKYIFPIGTTIPANGYLVVYAGSGSSVPQPKTGFGLKREGDTLTLTRSGAAGGGIADQVAFGNQLPDRSVGRCHDGSWRLCVPTFGAANVLADTAPPAMVKINEWLADAFSLSSTDFIELLNTSALPVQIGGCFLTDNPVAWPDHFAIRQLTFVPAGGYVVFKADDDEEQGADHTNFKLDPAQGEIGFFDAQLRLLDRVVYGPQRTDVSQGRTPNGAPTIGTFALPTPGGPNPAVIGTSTSTVTPIAANHEWKFFGSATAAPANDGSGNDFTAPGYDDSAWSPTGTTAAQLFSIETAALANTEGFAKTTVLPGFTTARPWQTYYFRTHFTYNGPMTNLILTARTMVDDGAVIYLNGQEAGRVGMGSGTVTRTTRANRTVGDAVVEVVPLLSSALVQGDNVIAVSVHQSDVQSATAGSSDVVWGMKLEISATVPGVVLNEVLVRNTTLQNPDGGYAGWIELFNPAPSAVDLSDMSLSNSITQPRKFVFPTGTMLAPGARLVVQCDGAAPVSATNTGFALNAGGGLVALYHTLANGGALDDSIAYGRQIPDYSIGRTTDGGAAWNLCVPTRDSANVPATLGALTDVRVNEWLAAPGSGSDFLELYHTGGHPVALGGAVLSDDLTDRTRHPLPELSFIGANGGARWMRWIADGDNSGQPEHVNFTLDPDAGAVGLFTREGVLVDGVIFAGAVVGRSGGRYSDGASAILELTPTPGAANVLATVVDADNDGMPDDWELAHGFNPGNGSDAALDSDGDGQSNASEFAAGTDPHSASEVLHAEIVQMEVGYGIRFVAVAGRSYSVQYKAEISDGTWTRVSDVLSGLTSRWVEVPDTGANGQTRRFYRVVTPAVP